MSDQLGEEWLLEPEPICGFEKILKYAEIATVKWKLVNMSANYYIQYLLNLDEELLSKEEVFSIYPFTKVLSIFSVDHPTYLIRSNSK